MPWLCSAQPLPDYKQRRIPCLVSNNQPTAVRTIASALQLEPSLPAQSRKEHHARRPSRATAMRPGAIVRVRTRFDIRRRLSAQIPTAPFARGKVVSAFALGADDATKLLRAPRSARCGEVGVTPEILVTPTEQVSCSDLPCAAGPTGPLPLHV
jgi:hypothetical protein